MIPTRLLAACLVVSALVWPQDLPAADPPLVPLLEADSIVVDAKGVARVVVQPEFLGAIALHEQLRGFGVPKLAVHLVSPRVPLPRPTERAKIPPPVLSRLMLVGPEEAVRNGLSILRRLDRPVRSVRVCLTIAEVWGRKYTERGGSFLYDRVTAPDQSRKTIFRSLRIGFEPSEYVRSEALGLRPYEGTTFRYGSEDFYDDLFTTALRGLYKRGRASYVARPNLLLNEGQTGRLESLSQIPNLLVSGRAEDPRVTVRDEQVGVKLRIVPVRIGADETLLDVDVWFRIPDPVENTGAPFGSLELKERRVQTQVVARDGEPMLISGLRIRARSQDRMDPIPLYLPINPVFANVERAGRASEIWFVLRVDIREPVIAPGTTHHGKYDVR